MGFLLLKFIPLRILNNNTKIYNNARNKLE
ncbi:hypothetical protein C7377_0636 [Balneicella halophila]|uniref:Uncharacterized protein n=1 Tax=Balneicella halophila TaxID=1537566 RepID=A0A7L4US66_BALHA|nr:hypothetical protein C7377_0636 [Balneicella halophila]